MAIPRVLLKGVGDPFSVTDPRTCYISEDLEDTASNRVTAWTCLYDDAEVLTELDVAYQSKNWQLMDDPDYERHIIFRRCTAALLKSKEKTLLVPDAIAENFFTNYDVKLPVELPVCYCKRVKGEEQAEASVLPLNAWWDSGKCFMSLGNLPEQLGCLEGWWLAVTWRNLADRISLMARGYLPGTALDAAVAELADEVEEEEELEEEGEEEEEEEVDDEESEQEEGGEQQQAAVLWSGFDPAAHQLNRADKRSVWRCASSEGGAAVKFAALCCSASHLKEGSTTVPAGVATTFFGLDWTRFEGGRIVRMLVAAGGHVDAAGRLHGCTDIPLAFRLALDNSKTGSKMVKFTGLGNLLRAASSDGNPQTKSWLALGRLPSGGYAAHMFAPNSPEARLLGAGYAGASPSHKRKRASARQAGGAAAEEAGPSRRPLRQALAAAAAAKGLEAEERRHEEQEVEPEEEPQSSAEPSESSSGRGAAAGSAGSASSGEEEEEEEREGDSAAAEEEADAAAALGMLGNDDELQRKRRPRVDVEAAKLAAARAKAAERRHADIGSRDQRAAARRGELSQVTAVQKQQQQDPQKKQKRRRGRPRKQPVAAAMAAAAPATTTGTAATTAGGTAAAAAVELADAAEREASTAVAAKQHQEQLKRQQEQAPAVAQGGAQQQPNHRIGRSQQQQQQQQPQQAQQQAQQQQRQEPQRAQQQAQQQQQAAAVAGVAAAGAGPARAANERADEQPGVQQAAVQLQASLQVLAGYLQAQAQAGQLAAPVAQAAQASGLLAGGPLLPAAAAVQGQQQGQGRQPPAGRVSQAPRLPHSLRCLLDDVLEVAAAGVQRGVEEWMLAEGIRHYDDLEYADPEELLAAVPGLTSTLCNKIWGVWDKRWYQMRR